MNISKMKIITRIKLGFIIILVVSLASIGVLIYNLMYTGTKASELYASFIITNNTLQAEINIHSINNLIGNIALTMQQKDMSKNNIYTIQIDGFNDAIKRHLEIVKRNYIHGDAVNVYRFPSRVTFGKINPRRAGDDFDANGRNAHANDFVFFKKEFFGERFFGHPEITQDRNCLFSVGLVDCNPDVHIPRRPRITMMPYGIAPNQQIFNLMRVEKSQELFEVLMQFDLFHRPVFC